MILSTMHQEPNKSTTIRQVTWLVITEARSESIFRAGYRAQSLQHNSYLWVVLLCWVSSIFIVECGIACFLCSLRAMCDDCAYSMFGHHPHPLRYLCAKFRFFRSLHCWASLWRKIAYSITHSLNHPVTHSPSLFDMPGTEVFTLEQAKLHSIMYMMFCHE